jgi:hypothetical protein
VRRSARARSGKNRLLSFFDLQGQIMRAHFARRRPRFRFRKLADLLITVFLLPLATTAALADDWPGWRGDGSGVSAETSLSGTWSTGANLLWTVSIPGEGFSSPIVWNDRIFLTTATNEPELGLATVVLVAIMTVVAVYVLFSYLTCGAVQAQQAAGRGHVRARGMLLLFTFLAIAYLTPVGLDQVRARFPTLSVQVVGKPWQYSSEHSRHIRTDDFLAGILAAFALLNLRLAFRGTGALAGPAAPATGSTTLAWICWLQCVCILAMAATFLLEKTRVLAFSLVVFVIMSFFQLLSARRHPAALSTGCGMLNYLRTLYVPSMAFAFLLAVFTYIVDNPLFAPLPAWYQTADICSLGFIAAIGSFHPRSRARILSIAILVPALSLFALLPLLSHTRDDWWDNLRDSRFEVYGAIFTVSCIWFGLEWLHARSVGGAEPQPKAGAARASWGLLLGALVFAVFAVLCPPRAVLWRQVLCLDQDNGTIQWKTRCARGGTRTLYSGNSLATPTPVTDGQRIYAHFGDAGTYCLDYAGRIVWSHTAPVEPPPYGFSSSPVLWNDLLVVTYDLTATSFTLALDKLTGDVRWKADRTHLIHPEEGGLLEGYSTPIVVELAGRPQLINHAGYYLSGHDLRTGKELWHFHCPDDAIVVTPVSWKDLIIVGGARSFQAIQLKAENEAVSAIPAWRARRNYPDVSSPVVYSGHVYAVTSKGIATCLERRFPRSLIL